MNGVTILSTIHTQTSGIKGSIIFIFIAACIFLAISFYSLISGDNLFGASSIAVLVVCLLVCIITSVTIQLIDDEQYVYAIIDPDTSINEVLDKYEIMNIDGDLYKLKIIEKEED